MHLHEIIHAMNVHFPQAHYLLKTGLSCYINDASSRNQENIFHFNKFENYIKTNNLNFEKFEEFENIDEITSFQYVTGPLICNAIYRKGGKKLLLEYLNNTNHLLLGLYYHSNKHLLRWLPMHQNLFQIPFPL